ncbi:MAG: agmatinase [Bacteroidales bacterium]|nr:agmatinase [Bacteroidales bacterium]
MEWVFGDFDRRFTDLSTSNVVILPVPFDLTSTGIKGSANAPRAIIEMSRQLENYDIELNTEFYTIGIHTLQPLSNLNTSEEMIEKVYKTVKNYIKDKFIITIGGEHSVSIGAIKSHCEEYNRLTVVQLDAHADCRDTYMGSKYNHACTMARIKELCDVIHVGIRSLDVSEFEIIDERNIFYAQHIINYSNWEYEVMDRIQTRDIYITIDVDVFDPSIMPSTGTPEPGGLLWYETLSFLKKLHKNFNVVGFDVTELCPIKTNKSPDYMIAKLIYKMIGYKFFL